MRFDEEAIATAFLPAAQQRPFVRVIRREGRTPAGRRLAPHYQPICNAHAWAGEVRSRRGPAADEARAHENQSPHGPNAAAAVAESTTAAQPHIAVVSIPRVPFGPEGAPRTVDARYYRDAARNIRSQAERGNGFAGSNLTESVARLCDAAADALERDQERASTQTAHAAPPASAPVAVAPAADDVAPFMEQARELVTATQFGSVSMLQRRIGIGLARACRVMDQLEREGYVSAEEGHRARSVLVSAEEYQARIRERESAMSAVPDGAQPKSGSAAAGTGRGAR